MLDRIERRTVLTAAAVGLLVALLCVWVGGASANASARSSNSAKHSSKKVIHIFGWGQETAPAIGAAYPAEPWMQTVPEAAAKAINATRGSNVKVTFTFCNSKLTPTGSATCAQQAVSRTGCNGSPCTVAIDELDLDETIAVESLQKSGIPIIAPTPSSTQVYSAPHTYCLTGTSEAAEPGMGYLLKVAGAHKVGIVGVQLPTTTQIDQLFTKGIRQQGLTVNGIQNGAPTDPNVQPAISSVMANGADGFIYDGSFPGPAVQYVRSTYPHAKIAMPSFITDPAQLQSIPASATNGIAVAAYQQPVTATKVPGIAQYLKETKGAVTPGYKDFDYTLQTWLAMHFIANVAATIHGNVGKSSLLSAIKHADNVNMYGIMPPWNASQLGKHGAVACSPYHVWVKESLKNNLQVTSEPGVFRDSKTGKVAYVDPGFKAPKS
jgi:hypothetical protein